MSFLSGLDKLKYRTLYVCSVFVIKMNLNITVDDAIFLSNNNTVKKKYVLYIIHFNIGYNQINFSCTI